VALDSVFSSRFLTPSDSAFSGDNSALDAAPRPQGVSVPCWLPFLFYSDTTGGLDSSGGSPFPPHTVLDFFNDTRVTLLFPRPPGLLVFFLFFVAKFVSRCGYPRILSGPPLLYFSARSEIHGIPSQSFWFTNQLLRLTVCCPSSE